MLAVAGRAISKVAVILEMIKFEHTIFALPFALTSALIAANGLPELSVLLWILVAMVGARSAAMAFNRIADLEYDRLNPRTSGRALPAGILSVVEVWVFTLVAIGVFVLAAWMLNPLAFMLSPVALMVVLGYSYTKRFTALSHLVLGLALGIAPTGAWIAVTGRLDLAPMILSAAVMLWTAGFDIIYALQDIEFDTKIGLYSIPRALGPGRALLVSRLLHAGSVLLLVGFGWVLGFGVTYFTGVGLVAVLLAWEQSLVRPNDISRVNTAFFNTNGLVSIGFFLFSACEVFLKK